MSVLKKYFDKFVNQSSLVVDDFARKVNYDEDRNEFVTYEKVDYKKIQESNGTVELWSLDALLKAGINPSFPVHTGLNTRLEGIGVINDASVAFDKVFADDSNKNKE